MDAAKKPIADMALEDVLTLVEEASEQVYRETYGKPMAGTKSPGAILKMASVGDGRADLIMCDYVLREYLRTLALPQWRGDSGQC